MRASRYPRYWDFNLVRVERDPGLSVEELIAIADEHLRGLAHRRIDFDLARWGDPLRAAFEARGWAAERLLWMRHTGPAPRAAEAGIEEVAYEYTRELRSAWHREDFPDHTEIAYQHEAREVAIRRGARVFAVHDGSRAVGFAQLEAAGAAAEIAQLYVHPCYRGRGRGTLLTSSTIAAAGAVADLWICADDEDRAKNLYSRLGFRPVASILQFTRMP